jgi:hypothetical protein
MRCQFEQANIYIFLYIYIERRKALEYVLFSAKVKKFFFFSKYDILGLYPFVEHRGNET